MRIPLLCKGVLLFFVVALNLIYLYSYAQGSKEGWLFVAYVLSLLLLPALFSSSFLVSKRSSSGKVQSGDDQPLLPGLWLPTPAENRTPVRITFLMETLACLTVLGIGFFLRVWCWEEVPPGIWIDEILAARNGLLILDGEAVSPLGSMPLVPDWPDWVHTFNLYSYWVAGILKIFGSGDFGIKMISIVPGCITLVGFYFLMRELGSRRIALMGTIMLDLSRWHLTQSRFEWDVTFMVAGGVLGLAATVRGMRTGRHHCTAVGGILCGLIQFSYIASRAVAAGMLGWLMLLVILGGKRSTYGRKRVLIGLLIWCLSFVIAAGPVIIFYFVNSEIAWIRVSQLGFWKNPGSGIEFLAQKFWLYCQMFFWEGPSNARLNIPGRPLLPLSISILAAVGAGIHLSLRRGIAHSMTWMVFLCALGGAVPAKGLEVSSHRAAMTLPIIYLWAVHALDVCIRLCTKNSLHYIRGRQWLGLPYFRIGLMLLVIISCVAASAQDTYDYFVSFGRSRATWSWMGRTKERHLANILKSNLASHEIWVDSSFDKRTLGVLLWEMKRVENGVERGGLNHPPFSVLNTAQKVLQIKERRGRPIIIAISSKRWDLTRIHQHFSGMKIRAIKDRWGSVMFWVIARQPINLQNGLVESSN